MQIFLVLWQNEGTAFMMTIRRRVCPEAEKREVNHTDLSSVHFWSLSIQRFSKTCTDSFRQDEGRQCQCIMDGGA